MPTQADRIFCAAFAWIALVALTATAYALNAPTLVLMGLAWCGGIAFAVLFNECRPALTRTTRR